MAGLFSLRTASFGGSTQSQSPELWTGVLARWGARVLLGKLMTQAALGASDGSHGKGCGLAPVTVYLLVIDRTRSCWYKYIHIADYRPCVCMRIKSFPHMLLNTDIVSDTIHVQWYSRSLRQPGNQPSPWHELH
jgi:hypothetical protein